MMKKLKGVLLLSVVVLPIVAFTEFMTPAQAVPGVGTHRITAIYYEAYIWNDHDWGGHGASGEWNFFILAPGGIRSTTATRSHEDPGLCDFEDRQVSWFINGDTWFSTRAYEWDDSITLLGFFGWIDYWSAYRREVPFPRGFHERIYRLNHWNHNGGAVGDVVHYFKYYIENQRPQVGLISGPANGVNTMTLRFSTTGSDPEGDAVTFEWSVDGVIQPETGSVLSHMFHSTGTHTIRVRAVDYFGHYSSYAPRKTVTIDLGTPLDRPIWDGPGLGDL